MKALLRIWDFLLAVAVASAGGYFLPTDAMKSITTELIAFFSIQSAVILPAMIFTAGILKPDGLELSDAERYHNALKTQMLFWVVLLSLDFVAVVALIAGKALGWSLHAHLPGSIGTVDLSWTLPTVLYLSGSLAILRTVPFVRGVLSLLDLNSEMARKAIVRRNKREADEKNSSADKRPLTLPEGYGAVVTPKED